MSYFTQHFGFNFYQESLFQTGFHNAIPEALRPYIPKYDKSINPLFSPILLNKLLTFTLGMKSTPDQLFNSDRNKIYKIITTGSNTNNLMDISNFDYENEEIFDGMTALGLAASLNNIEVLHYLINVSKINVDSKGRYGKTPLHLAAEYGNELAIKYLVFNGADVDEQDCYGFDVYDKAEFRGYYEYKDLIKKILDKKNSKIEEKSKKLNFYIEKPSKPNNRTLPSQILHTHFYGAQDENHKFISKSFSLYFVDELIIH